IFVRLLESSLFTNTELNMNRKIDLRFSLIVLLILLAAMSRLVPHPPNFTPIGGMALFGAAYFSKKHWAFLIPMLALFISDLVINNFVYPVLYPEYYSGFTLFTQGWYWYYGAFMLISLLGGYLLQTVRPTNLLVASLLASSLFFLITNFGTWTSGLLYPLNLTGLLACYTAGLPFFLNTLLGDLFYVFVLFGTFAWMQNRFPQLAFRQQ
ncbi:MAG: DUF6580 family putative transport protein, partial [Bacteroidota bacterium]